MLMCVWVRPPFTTRGENERKVPPTKHNKQRKRDKEKEEIIVSFQGGRCGYLGLIFFQSLFFCVFLLVIVC